MTVFLDELAVPFEEGKHSDRLVSESLGSAGRSSSSSRSASRAVSSGSSVPDEPRSANGEPMPKETEPTKRSLREIPEVDFSKAKRLPRGKYAEKARRSFAVAIVEPKLFARFGSSDAVNAALRAVVEAADAVKYPAKAKRSSRGSKRTAA